MNNTTILQDYFKKYILCDDTEKNNVILECKKALPNEEKHIDEIKYILDELESSKKLQQVFINGVFDIEHDKIDEDLMNIVISTIDNKTDRTIAIDKITSKKLDITTFNNYRIEKYSDSFDIRDGEILKNKTVQIITEIGQEDTRFYNYIIEKLLGYNQEIILYGTDQEKKYLLSNNNLVSKSVGKLVKEEAICNTKEIEYYIDRLIENKDRNKCINRIFIDMITNQNYRNLENGFGVMNSDSKENDYYVLNEKTLKKEIAIESLYKNYYSDIKKVSNIILQNYDEIINLIEKIDFSLNVNKTYINNLKSNIELVYEKGKIHESLDEIETGKSVQNNENSNNHFSSFEDSIDLHPMKTRKIEKVNNGYVSIFALVSGIMIFGVLLAYIILKL